MSTNRINKIDYLRSWTRPRYRNNAIVLATIALIVREHRGMPPPTLREILIRTLPGISIPVPMGTRNAESGSELDM
jgi:hypothetical protein